jgi:hypothetical protein
MDHSRDRWTLSGTIFDQMGDNYAGWRAAGEAMAGMRGGRGADGVVRDLGYGLVLRLAEPEDAEALASFNARVHHTPGGPFERREPHTGIAAMTQDLLSGNHPACGPQDFTVVEDTRTGSVVSSAYLIEQRFSVPTPTTAAAGW